MWTYSDIAPCRRCSDHSGRIGRSLRYDAFCAQRAWQRLIAQSASKRAGPAQPAWPARRSVLAMRPSTSAGAHCPLLCDVDKPSSRGCEDERAVQWLAHDEPWPWTAVSIRWQVHLLEQRRKARVTVPASQERIALEKPDVRRAVPRVGALQPLEGAVALPNQAYASAIWNAPECAWRAMISPSTWRASSGRPRSFVASALINRRRGSNQICSATAMRPRPAPRRAPTCPERPDWGLLAAAMVFHRCHASVLACAGRGDER